MPKLLPAVRNLRIGALLAVLLLAFAGGAAYDLVGAFSALPATAAVTPTVVRQLLLHAAVSGLHIVGTGVLFAILNFYHLQVPDKVGGVTSNPVGAWIARKIGEYLQGVLPPPPTFDFATPASSETTEGTPDAGQAAAQGTE